MADFAPPPGPPPPKVPEGWKAIWNDQYHEWFFVNIYTKQSTWEKPTDPVYPPGEAPHGAPPAYGGAAMSHPTGTSEKSTFGTNNPYGSQQPGISEDEKLARKLQEEEARAGHHSGDANRGASNDYYGSSQGGYGGATGPSIAGAPQSGGYPQPGGYSQQEYQAPSTPYQQDDKSQTKGRGLLGKLIGKSSHGSSSHAQPAYGQPAYAGGGGYGGQSMYQQRPGYAQPAGRRHGGGMGMGGMALGAGAGMLGGVVLGEALGDAGDGGGFGGDGGGFGGDGGGFGGDGGDFGGDGGDFGGDMGGDF